MLQRSLEETIGVASSRYHVATGKGHEDHAYPHSPTKNKKPEPSAEHHPGQVRRSVADASPKTTPAYPENNSIVKCKTAHLESLLPNLHYPSALLTSIAGANQPAEPLYPGLLGLLQKPSLLTGLPGSPVPSQALVHIALLPSLPLDRVLRCFHAQPPTESTLFGNCNTLPSPW